MKQLKNYLLAGLLVWLPIGLTIWIIEFVIHTTDRFIPIETYIHNSFGITLPGSSLIVAIVVLLLTGIIAKNFLGQKILKFSDSIISHIPIVKSIYKGVKQVSDTLLSNNSNAFRKALLVKFPHTNALTIAFITGNPSAHILVHANPADYINVYVPTTPNPTSGYFIIVPKDDTYELDLSVDEALRYVISMGSVRLEENATH